MAKKRFKLSSNGNQNIYDREECYYYSSIDTTLCDLLNDLEQEIKDNKHYHLTVLKSYIWVSEENEKFKKELRIYRKLARCSNCKYHSYDWFDDGNEFEVCEKGNDVTEGICEDWEELE